MSDSSRQAAINWIGMVIAMANTGLLFYICWGLFNRQFTVEVKDPVMLALGVLLAKHGDILQWAFGSSAQAKKHSDTADKAVDMAKAAQAAALPAAPADVTLQPGQSATVSAEAEDGATTKAR